MNSDSLAGLPLILALEFNNMEEHGLSCYPKDQSTKSSLITLSCVEKTLRSNSFTSDCYKVLILEVHIYHCRCYYYY